MTKVTFPEPEAMTSEETLNEEQIKEIQAVKDSDWVVPVGENKPEEKPPVKELLEKKPDEEIVKTPEQEAAEKAAKEEQEAKTKADAAESERVEKKAKELSKTVEEVKKLETDEKAEQERLEKIAKEENRTVDEVKAEEAKDKSIVERHGNDALKIARALRKEQSEYGKVKAETDQLRKFKEQVEARAAQFNEHQFEVQMGKGREDIIAKYREKFPAQADGTPTEELSDDACFEKGKAIIRETLKTRETKFKDEVKSKAETKRVEIVKNLPEEFKDYVPEVKQLIEECNDDQILDKEFDVVFLATYARGKKYTADYVKSLEEAAYKRGVEQPKILPKSTGSKPSQPGKEQVPSLTDHQRARAEEIYGRRGGWTKEQMHIEYAKNDLKNDF